MPLLYLATVGLGLFALFLTVCWDLKPPIHDEQYYLATVSLLDEYGISPAFLRALPGPAGPTYTFVQALARPLTGLQLRGARLVNFGLLVMASLVLTGVLRKRQSVGDPDLGSSVYTRYNGLDGVGVPMSWVMAGMALTEMPAILFASLSLFALVACQELPLRRAWLQAVFGGACLGVAVLGRQTLLPVLALTPILVVPRKGNAGAVALFCSVAVAEVVFVFAVWGGLSPPLTGYVGSGLAPGHGVKALACGGVAIFLLAPAFFRMSWRLGVGVAFAGVAANKFLGLVTLGPLQAATERFLSPNVKPYYDLVASGTAVAIAAVCLTACAMNLWRYRSNRFYLFLLLATLAVMASSVKVTHLFSSRYVGQALPLFVLLAAYHSEPDGRKAARILIGSLIGALSLWAYV